ncbi:O-antigen ligase family protein [Aeromonas jandaei]|uniref:O-antigen ligase family protein n=1 Tax=Aeromonas jandaei TaxID=650 RepID=UPI00191E15A3|nr:O-antigen ligase family protein [Aeromonas jandaei]MBL0627758.1 O-antigen ligase family protein [Aeromonas jandaei]
MTVNATIEKITEYFFALTIFFAFGFLYASARGHSYLSILVVISIILGVINFVYNKKTIALNSGCGVLLKTILMYGLVMIFNRLSHGEDSALVRITLFLTAFVFFVPKTALIKNYAIYGIIAGGWVVGFLAIVEASKGVVRVEGYTNAILFAQGALVIFILNLHIIFNESKAATKKLITIVGAGLSLIAIYLSQSRGVWLSLVVVTTVYLFFNRNVLVKNIKLMLSGAIIMFVAFSYNSNIFIQRVDDVKHDFIQMEQGNYQTSIGLRLVVWKSAWLGFLEYPLIGVGKDGIDELKKQQVSEHKVNPVLLVGDGGLGMPHAHNQYLNQLVMRGLVGFIPMMILLASPIFMREQFGLLGIYLASAYLVSGLTDVPLEQKETLYIFLFSLLFATLIRDIEAEF